MAPWAAHFASGNALFTGVALIVLAVIWTWLPTKRPAVRWRTALLYPAIVLIAASATPLPYWFYGVWFLAIATWWLMVRRADAVKGRRTARVAGGASVVLGLVAGWGEVRTLWPAALPASPGATVYVVGDSVSAGMNDAPEDTWPAVMGRRHSIPVVNLSQAGGTARSALRQAEQIRDGPAVVVVEIGGNDLLSGLPSAQFASDLRRLLQDVCRPERRVLLMELPLPPLCNEYGRAQRALAAEYGCQLISKRTFVAVLAAPDGTVDSVHLSPSGHELLADRMWTCVGPVLGSGGPRRRFGGLNPRSDILRESPASRRTDSIGYVRGDGIGLSRRPGATDRRT